MSLVARVSRVRYALQIRGLATPAASSSARSNLSEALDSGPGLDDFISGSSERVVLGNVTAYVLISAFKQPPKHYAQSTSSLLLEDIYTFGLLVQKDQE